jgi:hypothetical protein
MCRIYTMYIKIPMSFFKEIEKSFLKFIWAWLSGGRMHCPEHSLLPPSTHSLCPLAHMHPPPHTTVSFKPQAGCRLNDVTAGFSKRRQAPILRVCTPWFYLCGYTLQTWGGEGTRPSRCPLPACDWLVRSESHSGFLSCAAVWQRGCGEGGRHHWGDPSPLSTK